MSMTKNDMYDMMEEMGICPKCHDHKPCGCDNEDELQNELVHTIVKVCTGCRKMYEPLMFDDGDCCPPCARY